MSKNLKLVFLLFLFSLPLQGRAQQSAAVYFTPEDVRRYAQYRENLSAVSLVMPGDFLRKTVSFFLEVPYVASTLEKEPEGLVVNLQQMDCMTLVETSMAMAQTLCSADTSFDSFCRHLRGIRYRNGAITDYTDRLHYISDWIYENQKTGRLKDITCEIGGRPLALNLNFMSTHPDAYRQLKDAPERVARMVEKEKEINARSYCYIPEDEIEGCVSEIRDGDIICFVTRIKGLDVSHVGVACRNAGHLTFIHASSTAKKVIVNEEPLVDYVKSIKSNIGIMVIRPQKVH